MKLLDLYCGEGGAAVGYFRVGFTDITGVDICPMPHYPFKFIQTNALEYLAEHGREYDVIHASPPCQGYSITQFMPGRSPDKYKKQVGELRDLLIMTGKPYVIENVAGAPLINPLMLCGTMFGLRVFRHRYFECNPPIYFAPATCNHWGRAKTGKLASWNYGQNPFVTVAGHMFKKDVGAKAMGIDWMTKKGLAEAVPPDYTEYIGRIFLDWISIPNTKIIPCYGL